ncbi:MAG: topoisomerase C-terminal repeat-containing protein [Clostridia bacterium]|nr:topoisomerase C-terminal repeat-containing protein [Clostridia bacterium]
MQLIIAEKPSLGRNIVDAINGIGAEKMQKRSGYYEGAGYIVTWAFGHLFSLSDIEYYSNPDYDATKGEKARWTMDNLPCFPTKFNFSLRPDDSGKADSGVISQFNTIKALCNRDDVDTIINAGDADREGEIIVRICITKAFETESETGSAVKIPESKALKRLWLPDQTAETIRASLKSMKDSSEYDLLAYEGYARTFIDWLYGVNLTRYATLKCGPLIRVGRVIVPIVKAVYDRDMQIKGFVPEPYYALVSKAQTGGEEIELQSKKRFGKDEQERAEAECARLNAMAATVTSVKKKKTKLPPGKLYSLTKLQNVLSKKYKMPMNESLAIAQKLYEQGYLTYPRTNSEYLATAEKDKMKQILSGVAKLGYPVKFRDDKSIFDDSKIEAHSALTPTFKIPAKNSLSEKENQLYSTVFRRFVAVFCEREALVNRTEITIALGDGEEEFSLKGAVVLEKGWTEFDDSAQKDKILPELKKGDTVNIEFKPCERTTTPPKHYTVETLNNYLKNPFREDKAKADESENDEEDYRAIFEGLELGTEATRTGIIDNALKSGYMALNKDVYTILPKGEYMIEQLLLLGISMDKYKTSQLGQALKKVYKGEISIRASLRLAQNEIAAVFATNAPVTREKDMDIGLAGQEIGACPLCKRTVVRGRYNYGCVGYKEGCEFRIPLSLCKRPIPVSAAKDLLEGKQTVRLEGFVSKNGKAFAASLALEDGKVSFKF